MAGGKTINLCLGKWTPNYYKQGTYYETAMMIEHPVNTLTNNIFPPVPLPLIPINCQSRCKFIHRWNPTNPLHLRLIRTTRNATSVTNYQYFHNRKSRKFEINCTLRASKQNVKRNELITQGDRWDSPTTLHSWSLYFRFCVLVA